MAGGERFDVVQPHRHAAVLGTSRHATHADAEEAVRCAKEAAPAWQELSFDDRAAVFLKAADLLAGPWRQTLNAATMLGQSKTAYQAEIDSACELVDFWRWNVHFAREVLAEQPVSSPGVWNRVDHRPLEGFVYAITPFNFTAIAGNLPTAPALMGNTVVWKPSPTQQFAAHHCCGCSRPPACPTGDQHASRRRARRLRRRAGRRATSPGSTSPARPRPSSTCGAPSARTSRDTAATRGSSARPAARTSSSRTRRPTSTCCAPPSCAAPSSTRARSARRRPGPTSRARSGRGCGTTWSTSPSRCRWATSRTSRTSWGP